MHGSLFHPEEKYSETLRKVVIWVVDIIAAAVFALLLFIWFGTGVPVQGRSMEPTILTGEQVYLDRIAYRLVSPDRFDCVVFLRGGALSSDFSAVFGVSRGDHAEVIDCASAYHLCCAALLAVQMLLTVISLIMKTESFI